MSRFMKGFLTGLALTALLTVGISYATQETSEGVEASKCSVRVGYGSQTSLSQCYSDRVMVGTRGDYILCARLEVTCP